MSLSFPFPFVGDHVVVESQIYSHPFTGRLEPFSNRRSLVGSTGVVVAVDIDGDRQVALDDDLIPLWFHADGLLRISNLNAIARSRAMVAELEEESARERARATDRLKFSTARIFDVPLEMLDESRVLPRIEARFYVDGVDVTDVVNAAVLEALK